MGDRQETRASTYRFTPAEQALMDGLGRRLAPPGMAPLARIDVLRIALARLDEAEGARKDSRDSRKNR